jgi:hypothetical protein
MDWEKILLEVEKEPVTVALEGDYPEIKFRKLKDGSAIPAGDLRIEIEAKDQHGIKQLNLLMNGLLLVPEKNDPHAWSSASDKLLKSVADGTYHLEAIAVDHTGTVGRKAIEVRVGEGGAAANWKEAVHQVILEEGETLGDKEVVDFPRLECNLGLNDDARLVLSHYREGRIWQPSMHRDYKDPQFVTLENGQLKIYRGTPGDIDAELYTTPPVPGEGPFKFGITVSRKLVIFREQAGGKEIVWRSH